MKYNACLSEKIFDPVLGILFIILGFTFAALGVTILPVVGFVISIPAFWLGARFILKSPSDVCEL